MVRTLSLRAVLVGGLLLTAGIPMAPAGGPPDRLPPRVERDRSPEAARRAAVWKALLARCRADKRAVQVYAESPAVRYVCFLSEDRPFVYDSVRGEVKKVILSYAIPVGINSITWEKGKRGGAFVLWFYGQREATIDPTNFVSS